MGNCDGPWQYIQQSNIAGMGKPSIVDRWEEEYSVRTAMQPNRNKGNLTMYVGLFFSFSKCRLGAA